MSGDAERLVVLLEARIRDFEKNMAKASGTAKKSYSSMRSGSKLATDRMERDMVRSTGSINRALGATSTRMGGLASSGLMGMTRAFTLGLAPILSVTAALGTAKSAMQEFDKIGKQAKSAGVNAEFFQELSYSAELGGANVDQLSQALNTFNKNTGLAAIGTGDLYAKLKALNPELLKSLLATTDQAERVRLAADAINKAGTASQKAALATTLFGDAGTRMVEVFKGGSAALAQTADKARDLGIIIDNDLIAKSEDLNDQFSTATKVMDVQFKQTLIDLAPILIETAKLAGNLATAIGYITQSMQELGQRTTSRLQADLADVDSQLAAAGAQYAPGVTGNMGVQMDPGKKSELQNQRATIYAELKRRAINQLKIGLNHPLGGDNGDNGDNGDSGTGSGSNRNNAAAETIKQAEAVKTLIDRLQFEQSLVGKSAVEQAKMNALRQAGAAATEDQKAQIASLIEQTNAEQESVQGLQELYGELGDIGQTAVRGIIDALADGKIEANEFGDILSNVLSMAADFFLNAVFGGGSGGIGSIFSGLFGKRETGGPVTKGQPYIVGEKRPELFVPDQSGTILPRIPQATGNKSSPPSQSVNSSFAPTFNISGVGLSQAQVSAAISDALERYDRFTLPGRVGSINNDPLARG
ncbi:hypothetical protein PSQ90_07715 [Devosia rhodophyticola]|uniref:Bacteriophage tail tape measure N-terminal domain-containing protein n=1 Tax=Devosia rhodophyticola TaxID=3026423 RepID=A0ABY7Z0W1_9HYPH|nr:hypothetical protein [Devosia rhodophyticola]WDR07295.1 hypothetical protein PSQ90_07715 [Devosia rhodophyticola]